MHSCKTLPCERYKSVGNITYNTAIVFLVAAPAVPHIQLLHASLQGGLGKVAEGRENALVCCSFCSGLYLFFVCLDSIWPLNNKSRGTALSQALVNVHCISLQAFFSHTIYPHCSSLLTAVIDTSGQTLSSAAPHERAAGKAASQLRTSAVNAPLTSTDTDQWHHNTTSAFWQ